MASIRNRRATERPSHVLNAMAQRVGCRLSSLGDTEQLAGVDIRNEADRQALWDQFRHLYAGPTQALFDAVMDHCASVALERIGRGELCLVPTHG